MQFHQDCMRHSLSGEFCTSMIHLWHSCCLMTGDCWQNLTANLTLVPTAVSSWLHETLQTLRPVHPGLRPPLPFPQPLHRPGQSPPLPLLHPVYGDGPPSLCRHGNSLPAGPDPCGRPRPVAVAHAAGWGVLGGGPAEHECPDAAVGGVAAEGAVWRRGHGDAHLLQAGGALSTAEVLRTALDRGGDVSSGREETNKQRADRWRQNGHRHLKKQINFSLWLSESFMCTYILRMSPSDLVLL